jgi:hypothetical protein
MIAGKATLLKLVQKETIAAYCDRAILSQNG